MKIYSKFGIFPLIAIDCVRQTLFTAIVKIVMAHLENPIKMEKCSIK